MSSTSEHSHDSESVPKITKAARMMAKMGYEKGQGLGKDGAGIVDPIQGEQNLGRQGLGFEAQSLPEHFGRRNKWASTPIETATTEYDFESTLIYITCLPHHSEPSYIKSLFGSDEHFEEIYAPSDNGGIAWVEFKTPDEALAAVSRYNLCRFGPNSQKIEVTLVPQDQNPANVEYIMRYTDFVRNKNLLPATSTVLVSHLPNSGPKSNIYAMVDLMGMDLPGHYDDDEPHGIKHDKIVPGGVLVQFMCVSDAESFRCWFNGDYWKNNTLHVDYCHDSEMEELLGHSNTTSKESMKLYVRNTQGITGAQIRAAVAPIVLNDVQLCGGFAFVFLAAEDAVTLIGNFSKGLRVKGNHYIYPKPPGDGKKDKKDAAIFAAARARLAAAPPQSKVTIPPQPRSMASLGSKQTLPSKVDFPVLSQPPSKSPRKPAPKAIPAWLSDPTPAPPTHIPSSIEVVTAQAKDMSLTAEEVRVKLNKLPAATTEADVRTLFEGFQLTGEEIVMHKSFAFVWLTSTVEAERAVATLHKGLVHGKAINVNLVAK